MDKIIEEINELCDFSLAEDEKIAIMELVKQKMENAFYAAREGKTYCGDWSELYDNFDEWYDEYNMEVKDE